MFLLNVYCSKLKENGGLFDIAVSIKKVISNLMLKILLLKGNHKQIASNFRATFQVTCSKRKRNERKQTVRGLSL